MEALRDAEPGSDEALVRDLGLLVRELLGRSNPSVFQALDELDLSFSQTKIIMAFAGSEEPRSIKAIADGLGISLPAASRAIDALLKRGLVTRTEDPADRRSKLIGLTGAGRDITRRLFELRVAGIEDFVASLGPADRDRLRAALGPIVDA